MSTADPSELLAACASGNEQSIEQLVQRYQPEVFRLALSILGDPADAHEIAQESLLAALRSLPRYRENASFKAWLFRITLNLCRSNLRRRRRLERLRSALASLLLIDRQTQAAPEDVVIQNETEAAVWKSLDRLEEGLRMVVILRYFHDLAISDISEILDLSEGTVHSRLFRARDRLRSALSPMHGG